MEQDTQSEEIEVCEFCEGTGLVDTEWINPQTHLPEPNGVEKCICQLELE